MPRECAGALTDGEGHTETMLAAKLGLSLGYRAFILLGGLGGRLVHTHANFQTLAYLRGHARGPALRAEGETLR